MIKKKKIQVIAQPICSISLTCAAAFRLAGEVERLEQELEKKGAEIEQLQEEKAVAINELGHQEKLQRSLRQQNQEQQQRQEQLEMELDTKSELVCNRAFLSLCSNYNIQSYNMTQPYFF